MQENNNQDQEEKFDYKLEIKAHFFAYGIWIVIGLFLYGFVQFLSHFEPKTRLKYADVTVEERLRNSPKIFSYFNDQAQLIFAEKLAPFKYDDISWVPQKMPYKLFQFEISDIELKQQQFEEIYISKLKENGWERILNTQESMYYLDSADYSFMDQYGHRIFIYQPIHNLENPHYWKISMVENSGIYEYNKTLVKH